MAKEWEDFICQWWCRPQSAAEPHFVLPCYSWWFLMTLSILESVGLWNTIPLAVKKNLSMMLPPPCLKATVVSYICKQLLNPRWCRTGGTGRWHWCSSSYQWPLITGRNQMNNLQSSSDCCSFSLGFATRWENVFNWIKPTNIELCFEHFDFA